MTSVNVTSKNAQMMYFDIESLENVFTLCAYMEKPRNTLLVFYLVDKECELNTRLYKDMDENQRNEYFRTTVSQKIMELNPDFTSRIKPGETPQIYTYDLRDLDNNIRLAQTFGLSDANMINNVNDKSKYTAYNPWFRLTCDTDPDYDPTQPNHYYIAGYNSFNYDTVMLTLYLMDAFQFIPSLEAVKSYQEQYLDGKVPDEEINDRIQGYYKRDRNPMFIAPSPKQLRRHNNQLFTETYKKQMPNYLTDSEVAKGQGWQSQASKIRRNMILSGRYIDIAKFNEKQQRVGLKRLLGMLGYQILESDKLGSHNAIVKTLEEFAELLAYNVSDVVELGELFKHPTYSSSFDIKKSLLDEYPETIYQAKKGTQIPNVDPSQVRMNRLTPDSTSARFVTTILAPYKPLDDIETVSFMYPAEEIAKKYGIERRNVLDSAREFFYENITDETARAKFNEVYEYYKSIEGKNFNDSERYREKHSHANGEIFDELIPARLSEIEKRNTTIPYFRANGEETSCFVTFSTGGIHGAEVNIDKYMEDLRAYNENLNLIEEAKKAYPNPVDLRKQKGFTRENGEFVPFSKVLVGGKRIDQSEYKDISDKKPSLLVPHAKGGNKINESYAFTSVGHTIHEDFSSYYPNMLRNMMAFDNPDLGEDRYAKLLADKDRYHQEMRAKGISDEEKNKLNILRNGVKLLLNTASGAGDTAYPTNIRMNNTIISMRIIGQIMSWQIGQAQTLAGALIPSTNTDGLYSTLDEETNNRVLEEQQKQINVEIEPEPTLLVTKDSNNRIDLMPDRKDPSKFAIVSASGGLLACYDGPNPTQSLAHPAMTDHILAHYLKAIAEEVIPKHRNTPLSINEPFDREYAKAIIKEAFTIKLPKTLTKELQKSYTTIEEHNNEKLQNHYVWLATLFQNVIAASVGSLRFPVSADPLTPNNGMIKSTEVDLTNPDNLKNLKNLQHYNRVFIVKPGSYDDAVSIHSMGCYKVTAAMLANRKKSHSSLRVNGHPILQKLMNELGYTRDDNVNSNLELLPPNDDLVLRKVSGISPEWHMRIENRNLHHLSIAQLEDILASLDIDTYIDMAETAFTKNWMNK